jgi:long-chain acyl-CoA synthetase
VLCEDEEQRAKVEAARPHLPGLREVLTFADLPALDAEGAAHALADPGALAAVTAQVGEEDLFTYIYTSGTTGPPKGCMIRHRNYYEMAAVVRKMPRYVERGDVCLLYLPLAHNFGRLVHLAGPLAGYAIAFEPDPYAVADAMLAVRPTVFPSVPRVYEKVHTAVVAAFDEATGARRRLIDWALAVGREAGAVRARGDALPRGLAARHRLADRLVYSKVKSRLGGRMRLPISGGAPLARDVAELFDALDIRIMEGYGLTECTSAGTSNHLLAYRYGTVGQALPGVELRLAEDGELEMRSETIFAGYYKDPVATAEVLDADGWLRTGDIASIDADGFVTITDRKKDIIVTAGGKNIAPQNLENDLKASRFVSQALVVGDRRPYAVALVTLDEAEIARWAAEQGIEGSLPALAADSRVEALVQSIVDDVNRDRTRFEQIKRFKVLPRDFLLEEGEITPTLKLRRRVCVEHFADEVDALYAAGADAADDAG